ncbi:MAG TPA: glutathione S-transferase family protein [Caulobacteraceae bacterium]|jgi:glutathione S-transferase|nr:glutathione S-transferase family protein [Caulobacteraceae bacterium]
MSDDVYEVYGALGSPYSLKMRAVMRYRRLPHTWNAIGLNAAVRANVKVPVIPVIRFGPDDWRNDSTPMIEALEQLHPERSLLPDDPADAFLAYLIEDMADEWGTKMMFHYRWAPEEDQLPNAFTLAQQAQLGQPRAAIDRLAVNLRDRQVGRMAMVGCTPANAPLIEATARQVLALIDAHVPQGMWLFGERPSLADIGWYGQFSQLARDPTPRAMIRRDYPAAFTWIEMLDDASGLTPGAWRDPHAPASAAVAGLCVLASEVYLPFLAANAAAQAEGRPAFSLTLLGHPFAQAPFGYQAKCLSLLRAAFAALDDEPRARVEAALAAGPGAAILAA